VEGQKEFYQLTNIAQGSASESDTQVESAKELEYVTQQIYEEMISQFTNK